MSADRILPPTAIGLCPSELAGHRRYEALSECAQLWSEKGVPWYCELGACLALPNCMTKDYLWGPTLVSQYTGKMVSAMEPPDYAMS